MDALLPQADSMVRQTVPGMLDAAGLAEAAAELRALDVHAADGLIQACEMLRAIRASCEAPSEWEGIVEDATFWAEAALWAVASGDPELYGQCEARVRTALEAGFKSMILH